MAQPRAVPVIEPVFDPADPRIADYARIADPEWLRTQGLFVAEGRLVVQRLLATCRFDLRSLLVTPAALTAVERDIPPDASVFVADQRLLSGVTGFNFHRGCLGLARRPPAAAPDALMEGHTLLALEAVGNPDNVGGLFRVAAAFGVSAVLLDPSSGDPFYRKAIRTSMGSVLTVPFARAPQWPDTLLAFRAAGFVIAALTPDRAAQPLAEFVSRPPDRLITLLGAEGPGLSAAALAMADVRVTIPIRPAVDSLNVTVAAGIALSRLNDRS